MESKSATNAKISQHGCCIQTQQKRMNFLRQREDGNLFLSKSFYPQSEINCGDQYSEIQNYHTKLGREEIEMPKNMKIFVHASSPCESNYRKAYLDLQKYTCLHRTRCKSVEIRTPLQHYRNTAMQGQNWEVRWTESSGQGLFTSRRKNMKKIKFGICSGETGSWRKYLAGVSDSNHSCLSGDPQHSMVSAQLIQNPAPFSFLAPPTP